MPFIWVLNGNKIKNLLFILVTAFFAALVAFVQNQQVAVFTAGTNPHAISSVQTDRQQVALTFDLGKGDIQIEPIIKALKENEVAATFFVSGSWAKEHPETIKEMKEAGFEIESHGMNQETTYAKLSESEIKADLEKASKLIGLTSGQTPQFVRPPNGEISEAALKAATSINQKVILWDVDPQDYTNPGDKAITSYVLKHVKKGSIIRLNATDTARQTERALPLIINGLQEKGFALVPLSTLITDSKTQTHLVN